MARNEDFRKVSTTLFHNRDSQAGDWSGLLENHKNLMNHQLYIVASDKVPNGSFMLHVIPDTDVNIANTVATGRVLSFAQEPRTFFEVPYKDSAYLHFTGVIKGLRLQLSEHFEPDPGITLSAVLTSYSHQRQQEARDERFDYVSSTIIEDKPSDDLYEFSLNTPDHLNMAYHQLMIISDTSVSGVDQSATYEVRLVPDSDEELESTVYIDQDLFFPVGGFSNGPVGGDGKSFILWFGGIFRGIHLKLLEDPVLGTGPEGGHKYTAILSSSVERFDETVYQFIGVPPTVVEVADGLDDHLGDFDNPHRTSWDNLLNKPDLVTDWPLHKEFIGPAETLVIPESHQYLIAKEFRVEGVLDNRGRMVIL